MKYYTLEEARENWRILDAEDFSVAGNVRLASSEDFSYRPGFETVEQITPGYIISQFKRFKLVFNMLYALRLLLRTQKDTVLIVYGGDALWFSIGILNRLFVLRRRTLFLFGVFVEVKDGWRRKLVSYALATFRLVSLWSKKQIEPHSQWLNLPRDLFAFVPYKANHSKGPCYDLSIGNYVFAGGNGKRDYKTLTEAVRNTGIPVIISATHASVRTQIEKLPNVIALAAWEPAFAQLQAGARFTVVPMEDTGLKGGGEANMCNGMWHGKPVIAVDRMAAEDYIVEGETGFIVPPGDAALLRSRILELWNDPDKCLEMGRKAKKHVEELFTHEAFIRRLLRLAKLCGVRT